METIERIVIDSQLLFSEKEMMIDYFTRCWDRYYPDGDDTFFESHELKRFWCLFKILKLSELVTTRDMRAIRLLSNELNRNAQIFLNSNYRIRYDEEQTDES